MQLEDRVSYLEGIRDWDGVAEELEKGISQAQSVEEKAALSLRLGKVRESKFLNGVRALRDYQEAYKLHPALTESLERARAVYWLLGKLNMVQRLLDLELKASPSPRKAQALLVELGDVLCDLGDYDKATSAYARAASSGAEDTREAAACLEDVQVESGSFAAHLTRLEEAAEAVTFGDERARLYVRAARVARRFAPDRMATYLEKAYVAFPESQEAAALYEAMLAEAGRLEGLVPQQDKLLANVPEKSARADRAQLFGVRWALRHQNVDLGVRFFEEAVKLDAAQEGALAFVREIVGRKGGDWESVLGLAEEAASQAGNEPVAVFHLAQAGSVAWRQLGNIPRARAAFERLQQLAPDHEELLAFEAQLGGQLRTSATLPPPAEALEVITGARPTAQPSRPPASGGAASPSVPPPPATPRAEPDLDVDAARPSAPPTAPTPSVLPASGAQASVPPPAGGASVPPAAGASVPPPGDGASDEARIADLRKQAEKQESAKRYNEYVKTLVALAQLVPDAHEKVELYTKAAELYTGKFANQAEAVKAYEQVLALEPDNRTAVDYLRQMYEKRRDWEKLLGPRAPRGRVAPVRPGARRALPRHREARHRARQEARGLHRALERGARERRVERRRARALSGSTSARRTSKSSPPCSRSRPTRASTTPRASRC
jgi:tetratricopeptide (TPR) repeat protein